MLLRVLLRLLLSTAGSALVVVIATGATFLTTAPEWISLAFEPFSLLLLPGILAGMVYSRTKDLTPHAVAAGAAVFYFLLLFLLLTWRGRRRLTNDSASV